MSDMEFEIGDIIKDRSYQQYFLISDLIENKFVLKSMTGHDREIYLKPDQVGFFYTKAA